MKIMNRPNRSWSAKDKYDVIKPIINMEKSLSQVSRELNISSGMLHRWVEVYKKDGIKGLENKKKPGNPLMKYSRKKSLTELEKLEYENMKLRIENELLKKGYLMKGDGSLVTFKNRNKKNLKQLKF